MEIIWISVAALCLYISVTIHRESDFSQALLYYLCFTAAALMFLLRRYMRRNPTDKNNDTE